MSTKPPIYIMIGAQLLSVIGDSFGQRCSRVNFKHSPRHMMIGLCLMTALQMLIIFGILQLSLPTSISGAIYISGEKVPCYYQLDVEGKIEDCTASNCTVIPCKSQGPFSMFRSMGLHPFLFANGAFNIIYYNGEVLLYKEPLGLLFLVIAALSSTFLINPLNKIFGEPINQPIPPLIYLFGIAGSLLSVIEFTPKPLFASKDNTDADIKEALLDKDNNDEDSLKNSSDLKKVEEQAPLINDVAPNNNQDSLTKKKDAKYWMGIVANISLRTIKILIPMLLLMLANGIWMETSLFYNDQFRVNAFGYNSIDQILLPFYLFPFMLIVDLIPPLKKLFLTEEDAQENLLQAVKGTWKESGLVSLFVYRFLINSRAIIYFYLAIAYDLTLVYLELTLIRVVLNWLGAIILNLIVPKFINTTQEEKRKTFYPINIVLKCLGTCGVVISLVILNK